MTFSQKKQSVLDAQQIMATARAAAGRNADAVMTLSHATRHLYNGLRNEA